MNFQTCLASMIETDSVVIIIIIIIIVLFRHSHPVLRPQSLVTVGVITSKSVSVNA